MRRLHYLDNLRTFAMLVGIFVHASHLGDFGWFNLIVPISDHFRMATFFMVSGFFTAMMLSKRSASTYLRGRASSLLVPLTFGLLVLNPINFLLIDMYFTGNETLTAGWSLHLWFLISLFSYSLIVCAFYNSIERLVYNLESKIGLSPLKIAMMIALAVVFLGILLRNIPTPFVMSATIINAPYFLGGTFLFFSPSLRNVIENRICWPLVILAIGLMMLKFSGYYRGPGWGIIDSLALATTRCTAAFTLLYIFSTYFSRTNKVWKIGIDSIYSIYLLHYLAIYTICVSLGWQYGDMNWVQYLLICAAVIWAGLAFQRFVIDRSVKLSLLLSEKFVGPEPSYRRDQ